MAIAYRRGQTDAVDAISCWCEAVYGTIPVQEAVERLVSGLGAEAGMLVRTHLKDGRINRLSAHDALGNRTGLPLVASYADAVFGPHLQKARSGTIWLASENGAPSASPRLPEFRRWHDGRRMKEFIVLVLSAGPNTRDHVEMHYRHKICPEELAALNSVLPAMARTWASRKVGLISGTALGFRVESSPPGNRARPGSIIGAANPARLSRAEFRVCVLLGRGLTVDGVCAELALAEATVRSHLRNIYAKTGTSSLAELIFCLIGPEQPPDLANRTA